METNETSTAPQLPPRSGKGSSTEAWAAFAADHGITVADDADRDTIIAAVDAVFLTPRGPWTVDDPEQPDERTVLADGPGRTFAMTPAGLTFTYALDTGSTVRVWQYPAPKPKALATLDESSAASVTSWRVRVLDADGKVAATSSSNLDRTYSTAEVNTLIERLTTPS
ncbi:MULTISPECIES: hypothetical protein [unclassified Aeromicrobium]|uniref:hypothetical protein n=1 Tax=unclassified Aeromicrobium TaxID=2633570 RepID=UPI0028899480|nr:MULTISPECIES: hypothetical protein [unclassified Aeromicrobium]